ncbi:GNAT family N-acetyltransferase [Priestia endophytica]|uniref:GNAT family N-acetyltransferase n=1 Tax=Priestia endophytica TaxID=135735 RepID=UPI000DCA7AFF|nr:GNAT family N-acetyltransferase [Priestia endophytica]RAS80479.1 GNAT family N-acetyltransferase [Priestia endophytica]
MEAARITTEDELNQAFSIRVAVFVEEQGVSVEEELDEFDTLDGECAHILVYYDETPVGTGRVRVVESIGKLERICILKEYRKYGLGKVILAKLEEIAAENGLKKTKLHAQTRAQGFYEKLGYKVESDVFMEADIPHVLMTKKLF